MKRVSRLFARSLLAFGTVAALAQLNAAEKPVRSDQRRVVEPGGLITQADARSAAAVSCQPRRGDMAKVRGAAPTASGSKDVQELNVVVMSGLCKGTSGWMASNRLTPADFGR